MFSDEFKTRQAHCDVDNCWSKIGDTSGQPEPPTYRPMGEPHGRGCSLHVTSGPDPAGSALPLGGVSLPQPTPLRSRNGSPGAWRSDLISGVQPAVVTELSRLIPGQLPLSTYTQHPAPTTPLPLLSPSPPSPIPSAVVESYTPIAYLTTSFTMAAPEVHHLFHHPIADHSFSADRQTLAIARDTQVELYGRVGNAFKLKDELKGHDKMVTSVDIAPSTGRIVTCSQGRAPFPFAI